MFSDRIVETAKNEGWLYIGITLNYDCNKTLPKNKDLDLDKLVRSGES